MKNKFNKLYTDIYSLSKELIENVCQDLNKSNKAESLIEKYLDKPGNSKKKKDPNAPKRNKTSYMYFTEAMRPKIKSRYPDDTLGEVSKRLGKLWNNLKSKDKQKYEDMAQQDKKRYLKDVDKYKNTQTTNIMDTMHTKSLLDNSIDLSETNSDFSS